MHMYVQQLYTNCLSEAAYYIESNGECAIIDPLRDVEVYINLAKEQEFPEGFTKVYNKSLDELEAEMITDLGLMR